MSTTATTVIIPGKLNPEAASFTQAPLKDWNTDIASPRIQPLNDRITVPVVTEAGHPAPLLSLASSLVDNSAVKDQLPSSSTSMHTNTNMDQSIELDSGSDSGSEVQNTLIERTTRSSTVRAASQRNS